MKVKINTKEKFQVIIPEETVLSANMTENISETLLSFLNNPIKNVIIDFKNVREVHESVADKLVGIRQTFYEQNSSMVICNLLPAVEKFLGERKLLELMNVTQTESEAWDIVQMEEIERELF
jgi:anti-anti-sigma regulatory factor